MPELMKRIRKSVFTPVLFLLPLFFLNAAKAAPGDLDTTFDFDGKVLTSVSGSSDRAKDVAIQPDGKIVVVGFNGNSNGDVSVVRYNTDGSLDVNFGSGGKVLTEMASAQEAYGVAIQADGKIVVVGRAAGTAPFGSVGLHRYNTDGTLDTSFGGGDGMVVTDVGISSRAYDVVIQPDGKIVIVGDANPATTARFLVARYNPDGTPDNGFSGDGILMIGSTALDYRAYAVALQSDGKIIVGGNDPFQGLWIRINSNGTFDGSNSFLTTPVFVRDIAIQADGKIVFGGTSGGPNEPFYNNMAVARHNPDKSLDKSFGYNGLIMINFGAESVGNALAIQADSRIVIGGYVSSNGKDFALARLNTNGFLDVGFGTSGRVITDFGVNDAQIDGLILQSDGKIVAAGEAFDGNNYYFAAARYLGGDSAALANRTPFDFDGDGRADKAVFRNGSWYILASFDNSFRAVNFGQAGDLITPADFDRDGRTDIAVFRPANGTWYGLRSSDGGFFAMQFGSQGDIPRPGDFDGDGKADFTVFRPSNGTWYILKSSIPANSTSERIQITHFGANGDLPQIVDFDGDGKSDITVFRPSNGTWYWLQSTDNGFRAIQFGTSEDLPNVGDFDGDGKSDLGVFRPSNGIWYLLQSAQGFRGVQFGITDDKPVAADYDGDGKFDIAVWRPSAGDWYQLLSSNSSFAAFHFGASGDLPAPAAYVP